CTPESSYQPPSASSDSCHGDSPHHDVGQHPDDSYQEQYQQRHGGGRPDDPVHWDQLISHRVDEAVRGGARQSRTPFASNSAVVGALCAVGEVGPPGSLAFLKAHELLQLRRAVDAPPETQVHDVHVVYVDRFDGDPPWLAAISYLWIGAVPSPVQPPARGRYVVAPHWRCCGLNHEADWVDE
ncbi:MAG: hypothetical protein ACK53Y_27935, partial [bacterium]